MIPKLRNLSGLSDSERISALEDYIRELTEYIEWQVKNLDEENFTDEFLGGLRNGV